VIVRILATSHLLGRFVSSRTASLSGEGGAAPLKASRDAVVHRIIAINE
jgi:hypothetical protein